MSSPPNIPVLFFDFDNTITRGDVLDWVIERYSQSDNWRSLETGWQEGRISTLECLSGQFDDLRVSEGALKEFIADVAIDPAFPEIVAWAKANHVELTIVSDNVSLVVREILRRHGLPDLPVLANEIVFSGNRPAILFPFQDANCPRCAHCKAQHLRRRAGQTRVYVGDGLSDVCPALQAEIVFAKDSLADELTRRGVPYRPFESLGDVLGFLRAHDELRSVR